MRRDMTARVTDQQGGRDPPLAVMSAALRGTLGALAPRAARGAPGAAVRARVVQRRGMAGGNENMKFMKNKYIEVCVRARHVTVFLYFSWHVMMSGWRRAWAYPR
jgi:hypothetical protein